MAKAIDTRFSAEYLKGCNIKVVDWKRTKVVLRINPNPHLSVKDTKLQIQTWSGLSRREKLANADKASPFASIYTYTFAFRMAVPGGEKRGNMHIGNKVFDYINRQESRFIGDVNNAIGSGDWCRQFNGIPDNLKNKNKYHCANPRPFWNLNGFRTAIPVFESVNVSSIELTWAATRKPTPAPTKVVKEPKNCKVSPTWSGWTACSATCGNGKQKAYRMLLKPALNGGTCNEQLTRQRDCNNGKCPVDCKMSKWTAENKGKCDKTCISKAGKEGYSYRHYSRTVVKEASNGGAKCPANLKEGSVQKRKVRCYGIKPCPIDCEMTKYGDWTKCTEQCRRCEKWDGNTCVKQHAQGKQYRYRAIKHTAFYGGKPCGELREEQACNIQACEVDCTVSSWSPWGSCSKTCAGKKAGTRLIGAKQERTRYVIRSSAGGTPCPALTQTKLCGLHPCGARVCTTNKGFPLTCTYEQGIVYTHHVNDVHDKELFMCYHNYVTQVCTCLCWPRTTIGNKVRDYKAETASDVSTFHHLRV